MKADDVKKAGLLLDTRSTALTARTESAYLATYAESQKGFKPGAKVHITGPNGVNVELTIYQEVYEAMLKAVRDKAKELLTEMGVEDVGI